MLHVLGTNYGDQASINLFSCRQYDRRCGPTPFGKCEQHAAPILRIFRPLQIASDNKGVDQLAGRLLGHTKVGDDLAEGGAFRGDEPKHVPAGSRHVRETSLGKCVADEQAVHAAARPQQRG